MRNYLRVRGEYCFIIIFAFLLRELPPRTRRIPLAAAKPVGAAGTTSAYAENTAWGTIAGEAQRNYLRVRGEYKPRAWAWAPWRELPPRTRRIQDQGRARAQTCGTTSAYAENTRKRGTFRGGDGNYLRVRGEYYSRPHRVASMIELPPRTRRIQTFDRIEGGLRGTTSAYAENTQHSQPGGTHLPNYLRVRGEYCRGLFRKSYRGELPPRTRRIHLEVACYRHLLGTTSAYAENTTPVNTTATISRNYLRVRGEYLRNA